jgi:hypothetical protein
MSVRRQRYRTSPMPLSHRVPASSVASTRELNSASRHEPDP